jgi:flavorubredoxin
MKGLRPVNKVGAAFGSFGWSGEAVKHMTKALEDMKVTLIDPGLSHQFVPQHEALKKCVDLGRRIAKAVKEQA